jgi:hypothetical protein
MQAQEDHQESGSAYEELERTNPAKRLISILSLTSRMADQAPMLQVWGSVFGIAADGAQADPHAVSSRLGLVRDEVLLLRKLMSATSFSSDLYEPALVAVLSVVSVANLSSSWGNFRPNLGEHQMLALRWCAQAIESEDALSHEELQRLLDALTAFRKTVEEDDLPEPVRVFVLHQVDLIVRGINDYPIRGRQAMRDAAKQAAADVIDRHDDIAEAAPVALREKLAGYWRAGLGAAEGGQKMVTLVTGIAEAVPKLVSAVHAASNSLG